MVITPQQVEEKVLKDNHAKLRALEEKIDEALVKGFRFGDLCGVCVNLGLGERTPLYRALENKYNQAGWIVKYEYEQRGGDFVRFTAKRGTQ
jgi:hypothetical protein